MLDPDPPRSPRLTTLATRLDEGDRAALDSFWSDVEAEGAPLVEPIEGDPRHRVVTFLWRDRDGDTNNVIVLWGPAPYWDVPANAFERLSDTDLWFKTYRVRSDMRGRYILSPNDPLTPLAREGTDEAWRRYRRFIADPLNPSELVLPRNPLDPDSIDRRYSILELTDAPAQQWAHPRGDVPKGTVTLHSLRSDVLGNERSVWVYTPADYEVAASQRLLVMLDGRNWMEQLSAAPTFDNLIADRLLPPTVVVLVDSLDWQTRSRELTCHEPFLEFLSTELLPWVSRHWSVTSDPAGRVIDGLSYGGLTALLAGLLLPDTFGHVIAHSPSLWWAPDGEAPGWLVRQYEQSRPTSVRTYLEVGLNEGPAMLPVCRHMREVMAATGFDLEYVEYNGGHDLNCWRGGLADALQGFGSSTAESCHA